MNTNPNLVAIHNEAFAPLNQSLAQGASGAEDVAGALLKKGQQDKLLADKQAEDISAQETAQDMKAFQFTFSEIQRMGSVNPEAQKEVIASITANPDSKFMQMYRKYGLGDPLGLQGLVPPPEKTELQKTKEKADLVTNPEYQDAQRRMGVANNKTADAIDMAQLQDPFHQQRLEQQRIVEGQAIDAADFILNTGKNQEAKVASDAAVVDTQARIEEATRAVRLTTQLHKEEDAIGEYVDKDGKVIMATRAQALREGLKTAEGRSARPRDYKGDPLYHYNTELLAYGKERDAYEQSLQNGGGAMGASAISAAVGQVGGGSSGDVNSLKMQHWDKQHLPALSYTYVTAMVAKDKTAGDKLASQLQLTDAYIHNAKFRNSSVGKNFYDAMMAWGEGKDPNDVGVSIPPNPFAKVIKNLKPDLDNSTMEAKVADEMWEALNVPTLYTSIEDMQKGDKE